MKIEMNDREQMNDVFASTNLYRLMQVENCLWAVRAWMRAV